MRIKNNLSKSEKIKKCLRTGIYVRLGEKINDERSYKVLIGKDEDQCERLAIIGFNTTTNTDILLNLEEDVFEIWCNELSEEEIYLIQASAALYVEKYTVAVDNNLLPLLEYHDQ